MDIYKTTDEQKIRLYKIAKMMEQKGLPSNFISKAVEVGRYYEGVYDLFELWAEENDDKERSQIVSDIQDEINENVKKP